MSKKIAWIICTRIELWFLREQKLGSNKDPIFTFLVFDAESKTNFTNISTKTREKNLKYFGVLILGLGTFDLWKNQSSKISCYCLFNALSCLLTMVTLLHEIGFSWFYAKNCQVSAEHITFFSTICRNLKLPIGFTFSWMLQG